MNKVLFCAVGLVVLASGIGSCASFPTPVPPTHAPFALPTLIPRRVTSTSTATPTLAFATPTLPAATMTVEVNPGIIDQAAIASPTASSTRSSLPTSIPSPASAIAPGLYVTELRIDPPPVRGPDLKFYATFLNSMDREQNYRWAVYIFRADTQRGIGETTRTDIPIPIGAVEQPSFGSWRLPLGGPCEYLYAQVGWIDADNKVVWFATPSGALFQKGFTVCPP